MAIRPVCPGHHGMGPPRKVPYTKGMSTGVAARVAAVCTALVGLQIAHAEERRKVAVVALTEDEHAKALRKALYDQLQDHWALRSLGDATLDAALEGPLVVDDGEAQHLRDAKDDLARAEDFLAQFDYARATKEAEGAQNELIWVSPAAMTRLYADATLVLAQAYLGDSQRAKAQQAFGLVHRLDPLRRLDPGRYLPEIVEAYNLSAPSIEPKKLQVIGTGHVWIDGLDRGTAPGTFDVGAGSHLVQLTGLARITRGELVPPSSASVEIPDQAAPPEVKVMRARIQLAHAPDPAARAGAMQELARLLDVHDAVLIDQRGDTLHVQTWRDRAPGFSDLIAYRDQKPIDLLRPLAPAKPPEPPRIAIPFTPPLHVDDTPWFQKRWVQASAVTVVVVGIVGAIVYATRDQYLPFPSTIDVQYGGQGTISR